MRDENEHRGDGEVPEENPATPATDDAEAPRPVRRRRGRRQPTEEANGGTETGDVHGTEPGATAEANGEANGEAEVGAEQPAAVSRAPRFAEEGGSSRPILGGGSEGDTAGEFGGGDPDRDDDLDDEVRRAEQGDDPRAGEDDVYTLRERIADRVYDAREWAAESPKNVAIAALLVLASLVIAVGLGYMLLSAVFGEEPQPPPQAPSGPDGNPDSTPGDARGLSPADNAGEVGVSVNGDGSVQVVHRLGAIEEEWSGDLERRPPPEGSEATGDSVYLELSGPDSEAVFESVLAEDDARSWQGRIRQLTPEGNVMVASQVSDPGSSALDGRVPVVRGTYVVKGSAGGGTSASGTFEDTLVDESTIERIYEEVYVNDEGEGQTRSWRSEHNITGDGGLTPALIGYEPPGADEQAGAEAAGQQEGEAGEVP